MEQEQLQELLRILEDHGMKEEKKQVMDLAQYLDVMDTQLGAVLQELKDVKEQLGEIRESGVKAAAVRVVSKVEGKLQDAKNQVRALKERFMEGIQKTVAAFHEKGIVALAKTMDFLGIQKGMQKLHTHLEQAILAADRGMDRLGNIADEMHAAAAHIGNIGRELTGKEAKDVPARDVEKGAVFQIQKGLYHAIGMMRGMKEQTESALQKTGGLIEKAGKPSVRESLKSLKEEKNADRELTGQPGLHQDPQISFYAAECMEFTNYGEMREDLTLPEAVKAYKSIRKRNASSGPGIGFVLQDKSIPDYTGIPWPLFQGKEVAQELIDLVPAYREHPLVKQAAEQIGQYLPELTKGTKQKKSPAR
ncbi:MULTISPECIES: DUF6674 family protein [Clostridia]|uniref:DUF6674 family protein n=1 Tax=Clostridia TaxID=186801 RepID=UPI000AF3C8F3|nr:MULTISPECIES: DUF6674 family protein [Clostridia]